MRVLRRRSQAPAVASYSRATALKAVWPFLTVVAACSTTTTGIGPATAATALDSPGTGTFTTMTSGPTDVTVLRMVKIHAGSRGVLEKRKRMGTLSTSIPS